MQIKRSLDKEKQKAGDNPLNHWEIYPRSKELALSNRQAQLLWYQSTSENRFTPLSVSGCGNKQKMLRVLRKKKVYTLSIRPQNDLPNMTVVVSR